MRHKERSPIDPDRLLDAADALLEAIRSPDGFNSIMVVQLEPESAATLPCGVFTPWELCEAMALLLRLGLRDWEESDEPERDAPGRGQGRAER